LFSTIGYFVLLTWLPTYFSMVLGFDLQASAFVSVLPWVAMFLFANVGGLIADHLISQGRSMTTVRKLMQTIGFLGPATFLGLVSVTTDPVPAVIYMTLALALGSFSQSGVYSNHQDIGPNYSGILLGMRCVGGRRPHCFQSMDSDLHKLLVGHAWTNKRNSQ
jgi:MFS transporter, ACS family, solute carrier family 17 (sodium-dependent inorganic phosphate cotransporter), other